MNLRQILPFVLLGLAMTGCDLKADDSGAGDAATVKQVCDTIFDLCSDQYGWPSVQACYDGFLGSKDKGTICASEDGYLICVQDCLSITSCDDFRPCEAECWADNCE